MFAETQQESWKLPRPDVLECSAQPNLTARPKSPHRLSHIGTAPSAHGERRAAERKRQGSERRRGTVRAIEPLCMLWCIPGFLNNAWGHAFKLLRQV